ncbi:MAG: hypothetical protein IT457_03130 [Planctomycetes bacterium]|nr:hypothetical protein [Planctomycetota bacterium]
MSRLRRSSLWSLTLVVLVVGALVAGPLAAQTGSGERTRVTVRSGARPQGARIVAVAPAPSRSVARAYEGTRQHRDWRWYSSGGPAIARARFAAYTSRYAPLPRFHAYGYGSGWASRPMTRIWRR